MKKFLLQFAITLFSGLITVVLLYSGYTIYAAGEHKFESTSFFSQAKYEYHKEMNELFNGKIQHFRDLLKTGAGFHSKDFEAPVCKTGDSTASCSSKCTDTNVSTYCVSVQGLDLYVRYLEKLNQLAGETAYAADNQSIDITISSTIARREAIQQEVDKAKRAFEATVTVYDEFKNAYPIHKKYEEIMVNLLKYKSKLRDVRKEVTRFPLQFANVTSSACK